LNEEKKETMIPISIKSREKLKGFYEHGNDTYTTVLDRLMEYYEKRASSPKKEQ